MPTAKRVVSNNKRSKLDTSSIETEREVSHLRQNNHASSDSDDPAEEDLLKEFVSNTNAVEEQIETHLVLSKFKRGFKSATGFRSYLGIDTLFKGKIERVIVFDDKDSYATLATLSSGQQIKITDAFSPFQGKTIISDRTQVEIVDLPVKTMKLPPALNLSESNTLLGPKIYRTYIEKIVLSKEPHLICGECLLITGEKESCVNKECAGSPRVEIQCTLYLSDRGSTRKRGTASSAVLSQILGVSRRKLLKLGLGNIASLERELDCFDRNVEHELLLYIDSNKGTTYTCVEPVPRQLGNKLE